MVHHASLHCDTVSAAQLATSLLPRSPSTALQLSGTVSFPEAEEDKKRTAKSPGALEGKLSLLSQDTQSKRFHFNKQIPPGCVLLPAALILDTPL